MIYIKYTSKNDPTNWTIWAHEKGSKEEIHIMNSGGDIYPFRTTVDIPYDSQSHCIEYLTEEQVDLLKLELL